jgi:hypothetical protein
LSATAYYGTVDNARLRFAVALCLSAHSISAVAQVSHEKAESFVVLSDPIGAVIELGPNAYYGSDTLGPTPMRVKHVRGGLPGAPWDMTLHAIPNGASQCDQFLEFDPKQAAADTVHFTMSICPASPTDWTAVFDKKDVQRRPQRLRVGFLDYPVGLRSRGIQGSVRITYVIDTTGSVEPGSVEVIEASDSGFVQVASSRSSELFPTGHDIEQTGALPHNGTNHILYQDKIILRTRSLR